MKNLKAKLKPLASAFNELGLFNTFIFFSSFAVLVIYESVKPQYHEGITLTWIILSVITYTVFAAYFGYFFTFLLPKNYKKEAIMFYLQRRAIDVATSISLIIMELIIKSNSGDANRRDLSRMELVDICSKVEAYQKFNSHWERNEPYSDFFEYFSFNSNKMNENIEKLLNYSDVLSVNQITILLEMEKDTNSALTNNIKISGGKIKGEPATVFITEPYANLIHKIQTNSNSLLSSFGIGGSVA